MKKRRTKILLSLLATAAIGFSMVNAFTFQVENRNPFGKLNLSELVIRPTVGQSETMQLSGYTLKIKTNQGKLRVHEICDESGQNCKEVSSLGQGGGGGITASGSENAYCYKLADGNLECDNSILAGIIAGLELPDENTRKPNTATQEGYVTAPGSTNNGKVRKVGSDGTPGWGTDSTTSYTLPGASTNVTGGVKLGSDSVQSTAANTITSTTSRTYAIQKDSNGRLVVNVPRTGSNTTYSAGDGLSLTNNTFKVQLKSYTQASNVSIDGGTDSNRQYAVGLDKNGKLSVNVPWSEGGTSIWEIGNVTSNSSTIYNAIRPKSTYISNNLYLPEGNIYHDGTTQIRTLGNISPDRASDIYITPVGVSIGEMANKTAGLGVHGPITVGKYITQATTRPGGGCPPPSTERNTISIYASGAAGTDNFEILGSPRILLGVKNGGYLYFDDNNKLGINTTSFNSSSTLNVNGPIKIGNDCTNRGCSEANKGEIRYYEKSNVGYFVGCTKISDTDGYKWRKLTIGTSNETVSSSNNCNGYSTPYNSSIYESTIAQQTLCDN